MTHGPCSGSSHRSAGLRLQACAPHRLLDALAAGLLALLAGAAAVAGSFPGENGRFAYTPSGASRGIIVDGVGQLTFPRLDLLEDDTGPAWSPDGTRVAFRRQRATRAGAFYEIYVVNADRTGLRRLATSPLVTANGRETYAVLSFPTWCIDGATICYTLRFPAITDPRNGVWKVPAAGGPATQLLQEQNANSVRGHPVTREIVYDCSFRQDDFNRNRQDLCVHDAARGSTRRIEINGPGDLALNIVRPSQPRWTPDGERIVFRYEYNTSDGGYPNVSRSEIFSIAAIGGTPRRLTDSGPPVCGLGGNARFYYSDPVPSPDGATIAVRRLTYVASADYCRGVPFTALGVEDAGIYAIAASGGGSGARLVADPDARTSSFDWQPLPADLTVTVMYQVLNDSVGIDGLQVELRDREETGTVVRENPLNPGNGNYLFPEVPAGEYVVRVTLKEYSGGPTGTPAFEIRHWPPAERSQAAWAEFPVTVKPDEPSNEVALLNDVAGMRASSIVAPDERSRFNDMGAIFYELFRFVQWAKRELTPDTGVTVDVYTFSVTTTLNANPLPASYAAYFPGALDPFIVLGTTQSSLADRDGIPNDERQLPDNAPQNAEWHEYMHHLWFTHVENNVPDDCPGEVPHDGWLNDSTCDSVTEGIPAFFATAAQEALPLRDARVPLDWYGTFGRLEWPRKAWHADIDAAGEALQREDLALAALLWDLYDTQSDRYDTTLLAPGGNHVPVTYVDNESATVTEIWQRFVSGKIKTVRELRDSYGAQEPTEDLDGDDVPDVSRLDQVFLMHGFHAVDGDQVITASHAGFHYDVDYTVGSTLARNHAVGLTSRKLFEANGTTVKRQKIPRLDTPSNPNANLAVTLQDAAGRTLAGGEVDLVIEVPGLAPSVTTRRLGNGPRNLVALELPPYFDYALPEGAPLPECSAASGPPVRVTVRARVNGYESADRMSFDNCTYQRAVAAAKGPGAMEVTARFPTDVTPPESMAVSAPSGPILVDGSTTGFWVVRLGCEDPVIDGFASGCNRIEYRLDGGEIGRYGRSLRVATVGPHVLEYRSVDGAGNAEAFRSLRVDVAGADTDNDGLSDAVEATLGTDPGDDDSDDDGVKDGLEVQLGIDPRKPDSDGDGLPDGKELQLGTAVLGGDSDEDGLADGADNCPLLATPRAEQDTDGDGAGNACDSDDDNDGVPDTQDNCSLLANGQRDTDGDGYGNACDPDLDNNGIVNFRDLAMFRVRFQTFNADADFNESGVVDSADLDRLRQFFGKPPGPSGIR